MNNSDFKSHPFLKTNAVEEEFLQSYFVPPPYFDAVIGDSKSPGASIVLAPRGAGKTAQRLMVERIATVFLDTLKPFIVSPFKLDWRQVAITTMFPDRVVEHFDIIENVLPCSLSCRVGFSFDSFPLE